MPVPAVHEDAGEGGEEEGGRLASKGGDAEQELKRFADAKIDVGALATRLQEEGKESFNKSWEDLPSSISSQRGVAAG